ncbi:hypothetical protein J6590_100435, partial [Homalodisca vitripennis]
TSPLRGQGSQVAEPSSIITLNVFPNSISYIINRYNTPFSACVIDLAAFHDH